MKDRLTLGASPCEESCAQVGSVDYEERALAECKAYKAQFFRILAENGHPRETLPEGFRLLVAAHPHDFGTYHEVEVQFNGDDKKSCELVSLLDRNNPARWDDEARKELEGILQKDDDG